MLDTTRVKTYNPGDTVAATELNAIQDQVTATAAVVNSHGITTTAAELWRDQTLIPADAIASTVSIWGFVKLAYGGQHGRLTLPPIPSELALQKLRIAAHIPDEPVSLALQTATAVATDDPTLSTLITRVVGWAITTSGNGWTTIELTGAMLAARPNISYIVEAINLADRDVENPLILSSCELVIAAQS